MRAVRSRAQGRASGRVQSRAQSRTESGTGGRGRSLSPTPGLVALAFAALLVALSLVTWRQARALERFGELEEVRREHMLAEAERAELEQRIQVLRSRAYVVAEAEARLGMHRPTGTELVVLSGGTP